MRSLICSFLLLHFAAGPTTEPVDGWPLFAAVRFTEKYVDAYDAYFLFPFFDSRIKAYEGKEVTLKGHYLPIDTEDGAVIISKFPYAQCFFCGGAGPETAAEVYLASRPPRLKADQIVRVKGTLHLNASNVEHMNFILKEAEIILL